MDSGAGPERFLDLEGCGNFRDVGGYPAAGGRVTAWRRLFRSDDLAALTPAGFERLVGELGVRTVIDLRHEEDLRHHGLGPFTGDGAGPVRRHHLPLLNVDQVPEAWHQPLEPTPEAVGGRYFEMLELGRARVGRVLRILAQRDRYPVVVHCVGGRDRTGIVIALVLDLLGVPDDVIGLDYSLTDGDAHPETMVHLLEAVRTAYGSSRGFARAVGLSAGDLAAVEANLLDERVSATR